jgi:hypothetical protein
MHYYEIQFYYYDQYNPATDELIEDERTNMDEEFTFYCKTEQKIETATDMAEYLKRTFPITDKYHNDKINCIDPKHYDHLSQFMEIDANEFEFSCGISA